jgi:DNA-binding NarL/FixJ family response regulator
MREQRVPRAGATGYVRKDAEPETLLAAVRAVASGRTYIDPAIGHRVLQAEASDDLTPREREVLRHVALGQSNKNIATALDIGEETVKTHVRRVLAKLGAENRAQAAVRALARGVVSPEDLAG